MLYKFRKDVCNFWRHPYFGFILVELGYFKFNHKVFIIRAFFNNFKMFVSNFLKIIQFYPNCKPHMYAISTILTRKYVKSTRFA